MIRKKNLSGGPNRTPSVILLSLVLGGVVQGTMVPGPKRPRLSEEEMRALLKDVPGEVEESEKFVTVRFDAKNLS